MELPCDLLLCIDQTFRKHFLNVPRVNLCWHVHEDRDSQLSFDAAGHVAIISSFVPSDCSQLGACVDGGKEECSLHFKNEWKQQLTL